MSYLIDTNGWITFFEDNPVLSEEAARIMESGADCFISIASIWEAAIKVGIGKLKLPYDLAKDLPGILADNGFEVVGIELVDAAAVRDLERLHGDPFDRLQLVQARRRKWTIISRDPVFDRYGVPRVW